MVIELTEIAIAESMYAAYDYSRNKYLMMDLIVDYHWIDKAISVSNQKVVHRGRTFMWRCTFGWQLCVQWRDILLSWQALNHLKDLDPVETAEYAVSQEIYHKPEFNWRVNEVLKNMLRIISLVKKRNTRYLKKTHKLGIEVPKSVSQAYAL